MQRSLFVPLLVAASMSISLLSVTCRAQETESSPIHWSYSAYFGTGWYSVTGDRDVYVVRMTPRWDGSEASFADDGSRVLGLHFKAPVSVGLDQFEFDDPLGAVGVDNVSFVSINPGVDIEIPVNETWSLRPYASAGYGRAIGRSEAAWSYWAGVKSRFAFSAGKRDWRLISQFGFVGYTPSEGPGDNFWPLTIGIEVDNPMGAPRSDGDQLLLHWLATYTYFADDLSFSGDPPASAAITDQWEIGAAIGRRDSRIPIGFLKFDMLGLGYRFSSNGEMNGISFIFRSIFDD